MFGLAAGDRYPLRGRIKYYLHPVPRRQTEDIRGKAHGDYPFCRQVRENCVQFSVSRLQISEMSNQWQCNARLDYIQITQYY